MAQQTVTTAYINRVKLQDHICLNNNNNNEDVFGRLASMYRPCKGGLKLEFSQGLKSIHVYV